MNTIICSNCSTTTDKYVLTGKLCYPCYYAKRAEKGLVDRRFCDECEGFEPTTGALMTNEQFVCAYCVNKQYEAEAANITSEEKSFYAASMKELRQLLNSK